MRDALPAESGIHDHVAEGRKEQGGRSIISAVWSESGYPSLNHLYAMWNKCETGMTGNEEEEEEDQRQRGRTDGWIAGWNGCN